jgi:hypothetical protein
MQGRICQAMPSSTVAASAAAGEGKRVDQRHNAAMGRHNLYLVEARRGSASRRWRSGCWRLTGSPCYQARLQAVLEHTEVRGCFLGHGSFSVEDLVGYRGPKPQHHGASRGELREAATWIRRRSRQLREECSEAGVPYVDVGEVGFEAAVLQARRLLLGHG